MEGTRRAARRCLRRAYLLVVQREAGRKEMHNSALIVLAMAAARTQQCQMLSDWPSETARRYVLLVRRALRPVGEARAASDLKTQS